jgi:DNA-binding NarL/FixJ family response regulator
MIKMKRKEISGVHKIPRIVLASGSKFFLDGIQKTLENESHIEISGVTSDPNEVRRQVIQIKPNFLFLDNRTFQLNIHSLLTLITKKSSKTRVILFRTHSQDELDFPNLIYLTRETNYSQLTQIILREHTLSEDSVEANTAAKLNLTITEWRVIRLIASGFTNKQVATRLLIKEKTVKAHLTHIFIKLNFQNRYQLMIYANRLKRRARQ